MLVKPIGISEFPGGPHFQGRLLLVSGEETLPTVLNGEVGPVHLLPPSSSKVSNLLIDISITLYVGEPLVRLGPWVRNPAKVGPQNS